VNNGVMFVTTPNNQVIAIDAASGNLLWRYRRPEGPGRARAAADTSAAWRSYRATRCISLGGESRGGGDSDAKTGREVSERGNGGRQQVRRTTFLSRRWLPAAS